MQVHTHNEQDRTLNKNDHTAAVTIQHCPHKLSTVHTICNTSLGAVHAHLQVLNYSRQPLSTCLGAPASLLRPLWDIATSWMCVTT
eukprot:670568-Pelagomonas_calceolata.AAC.1